MTGDDRLGLIIAFVSGAFFWPVAGLAFTRLAALSKRARRHGRSLRI